MVFLCFLVYQSDKKITSLLLQYMISVNFLVLLVSCSIYSSYCIFLLKKIKKGELLLIMATLISTVFYNYFQQNLNMFKTLIIGMSHLFLKLETKTLITEMSHLAHKVCRIKFIIYYEFYSCSSFQNYLIIFFFKSSFFQ